MNPQFKLPLYVEQLYEILPHRYPMMLIDRVTEFYEGEKVVGYKNISANEDFFNGHFPGRPIMPGVLMLEALAQLGVVFARLSSDGIRSNQLIVFAGSESVKFRRPVVPGDQLRMEMSLIRRRSGSWKMAGLATVDGEKAVEAILLAAEVRD